MALLRNANTSELPESQVEYREPGTAKHWLTLVGYIVLALIISVLVVLAARWVYHKAHHVNTASTVSTTSQSSGQNTPLKSASNKSAVNSGSSGSTSSPKPASGTSSSSSGSSSTSSNSNTSGTKSQSGSAGTLPNNGPGDVVVLFAGSSLIAAGLHYAISLRRGQKR